MKQFIGWIVLIVVVCGSAVASGEEKLLRLEFARHRKSDPTELDRNAFLGTMPKDAVQKFRLECVEEESLEIKVTLGESFYVKNRIANKTITVRGQLVPRPNSSDFDLMVQVINKTHTGDFLPSPNGTRDEITNQISVNSNVTLEKGGTIVLGGLSSVNVNERENTTRSELIYQVISATLLDDPDAE